ncbi:hypothetical protein BJ742DRAFT_572071 [Cladochytrium replicatum]|nr:hypothetical protein BJ742DRAFT_572071 [Cladochytrium replicatum]
MASNGPSLEDDISFLLNSSFGADIFKNSELFSSPSTFDLDLSPSAKATSTSTSTTSAPAPPPAKPAVKNVASPVALPPAKSAAVSAQKPPPPAPNPTASAPKPTPVQLPPKPVPVVPHTNINVPPVVSPSKSAPAASPRSRSPIAMLSAMTSPKLVPATPQNLQQAQQTSGGFVVPEPTKRTASMQPYSNPVSVNNNNNAPPQIPAKNYQAFTPPTVNTSTQGGVMFQQQQQQMQQQQQQRERESAISPTPLSPRTGNSRMSDKPEKTNAWGTITRATGGNNSASSGAKREPVQVKDASRAMDFERLLQTKETTIKLTSTPDRLKSIEVRKPGQSGRMEAKGPVHEVESGAVTGDEESDFEDAAGKLKRSASRKQESFADFLKNTAPEDYGMGGIPPVPALNKNAAAAKARAKSLGDVMPESNNNNMMQPQSGYVSPSPPRGGPNGVKGRSMSAGGGGPIDSEDEEWDSEDEELFGPKPGRRKKQQGGAHGRQESLIDFLKSEPPPEIIAQQEGKKKKDKGAGTNNTSPLRLFGLRKGSEGVMAPMQPMEYPKEKQEEIVAYGGQVKHQTKAHIPLHIPYDPLTNGPSTASPTASPISLQQMNGAPQMQQQQHNGHPNGHQDRDSAAPSARSSVYSTGSNSSMRSGRGEAREYVAPTPRNVSMEAGRVPPVPPLPDKYDPKKSGSSMNDPSAHGQQLHSGHNSQQRQIRMGSGERGMAGPGSAGPASPQLGSGYNTPVAGYTSPPPHHQQPQGYYQQQQQQQQDQSSVYGGRTPVPGVYASPPTTPAYDVNGSKGRSVTPNAGLYGRQGEYPQEHGHGQHHPYDAPITPTSIQSAPSGKTQGHGGVSIPTRSNSESGNGTLQRQGSRGTTNAASEISVMTTTGMELLEAFTAGSATGTMERVVRGLGELDREFSRLFEEYGVDDGEMSTTSDTRSFVSSNAHVRHLESLLRMAAAASPSRFGGVTSPRASVARALANRQSVLSSGSVAGNGGFGGPVAGLLVFDNGTQTEAVGASGGVLSDVDVQTEVVGVSEEGVQVSHWWEDDGARYGWVKEVGAQTVPGEYQKDSFAQCDIIRLRGVGKGVEVIEKECQTVWDVLVVEEMPLEAGEGEEWEDTQGEGEEEDADGASDVWRRRRFSVFRRYSASGNAGGNNGGFGRVSYGGGQSLSVALEEYTAAMQQVPTVTSIVSPTMLTSGGTEMTVSARGGPKSTSRCEACERRERYEAGTFVNGLVWNLVENAAGGANRGTPTGSEGTEKTVVMSDEDEEISEEIGAMGKKKRYRKTRSAEALLVQSRDVWTGETESSWLWPNRVVSVSAQTDTIEERKAVVEEKKVEVVKYAAGTQTLAVVHHTSTRETQTAKSSVTLGTQTSGSAVAENQHNVGVSMVLVNENARMVEEIERIKAVLVQERSKRENAEAEVRSAESRFESLARLTHRKLVDATEGRKALEEEVKMLAEQLSMYVERFGLLR